MYILAKRALIKDKRKKIKKVKDNLVNECVREIKKTLAESKFNK